MADPTTVNKFLAQPTRGSDVGTWDTPMNLNTTIIDNSFGGVATIALGGSPVVLSSAQYQCIFLVFNGTLTSNVAVTFPAVGSFYTVQNLCSASSAFTVTAQTTAAGSQLVGLPPGEACDIFTDGANVKYHGLGRVGSYWDYAGSSIPSWLSACTKPPYLNCDGTTFSSATYPALATILGGTTLPDSRGRFRATLNQGTGNLTSPAIDGNTFLALGGAQSGNLSQAQLPNVNFTVNDSGHSHLLHSQQAQFVGGAGPNVVLAGTFSSANTAQGNTDLTTTGITVNSGGSGATVYIVPPGYIAGLTFVRAA